MNGMLYLVDTTSGEVVWQFEAGGRFTASPAVVDGKIVLGNGDGALYCFGPAKSPAKDPAASAEPTESK
jgi:outer membrane protein assembly factor BamB